MEQLPSSSVAVTESEAEPLELLPPASSPAPGDTDARQRSLEAAREDIREVPENRRTLAQQRSVESLGGRRRREEEGGDEWQRGERDKR